MNNTDWVMFFVAFTLGWNLNYVMSWLLDNPLIFATTVVAVFYLGIASLILWALFRFLS